VSAAITYRLLWPGDTTASSITSALRSLATTGGTPLTLDSVGEYGVVEHRLVVDRGRGNAVVTQLRVALPGIGIERVEPTEMPRFELALELRLTTGRRSLRSDNAMDTSRSVLGALANVGRGERIRMRWLLTDRLHATAVPSTIGALGDESLTRTILRAPFSAPRSADADVRGALRDKQREPGWRIIGHVAVQAASPARRQQLANAVLGALRGAEAPGVRLTARSVPTRSLVRHRRHGRLNLNAVELAAVSGWPIGPTAQLPVVRLGSRRLPASSAIPSKGRTLGQSTWPGASRPLALSPEDGLPHLHLLGPTGTGKSTLMLSMIRQDMAAGRSLIVVDPKSDLIADVLARVPDSRRGDVVIIDASSSNSNVVGINPLARRSGVSPDVAADELFQVFHGLYADSWGVRVNDILAASLLTLTRVGGHSLVSVPTLLTDAKFRRRIVARLNDPVGLTPFWDQYEAWSEGERTTAIAPVLNRLRPFLMRANLRRIVGQPTPRFDFTDLFTQRRIVLVDLAKGRIGAEASQLLGALVLAQVWQAALSRTATPAAQRHPVTAYLDEFQAYLAMPISLEDALAQSRGLGLSFVLAHQHLKQLTPSVKASVMANARSRVCFQQSGEDARELARDQTLLSTEDFTGLDAFHFYAQLVAGNKVQPWCSGRTTKPSEPTANPTAIRAAAAERYGTPASEIDSALESLARTAHPTSSKRPPTDGSDAVPDSEVADDLSPRRRRSPS
jgi:hypothetical protein